MHSIILGIVYSPTNREKSSLMIIFLFYCFFSPLFLQCCQKYYSWLFMDSCIHVFLMILLQVFEDCKRVATHKYMDCLEHLNKSQLLIIVRWKANKFNRWAIKKSGNVSKNFTKLWWHPFFLQNDGARKKPIILLMNIWWWYKEMWVSIDYLNHMHLGFCFSSTTFNLINFCMLKIIKKSLMC